MKDSKNQSKKPMIKCPECGSSVRFDRLEKQVLLQHKVYSKLSVPKYPDYSAKSDASRNKKRKAPTQTVIKIKSRKRRCFHCEKKFTWEQWPTHKQDCEARASKRLIVATKPLPAAQKTPQREARPAASEQKPPKQGRVCPFCEEPQEFDEWREHVRGCEEEYRRKTRERSRVELNNKFTTALQQKKYVSDKYGNVQGYDTWFENESMGKSDPDKRWQDSAPRPKTRKSKPKRGKFTKTKPHLDATCPECGARLKSSNLERHFNKVHCK